jgi:hypothetical protein
LAESGGITCLRRKLMSETGKSTVFQDRGDHISSLTRTSSTRGWRYS